MTPVNLYYEVENAFALMDSALENARQHATPEGKLLYEHLKDELIGLKDHYRQELLILHTKNAAPAVGATETAKSDSEKESNFSLDENAEDVKRSRLILEICDSGVIEIRLSLGKSDEDLLTLLSAATYCIAVAAVDVGMTHNDVEEAFYKGLTRAFRSKLEQAIEKRSKELGPSKRESLLRAVEACEDLRFGGEGK